MTKYKIRNFSKQTFEVSIKTFCRKWEGEALPKWFFNLKHLEKCQIKYYPDNLNWISFCSLTSLQLLMFPISLLTRNLLSYWKLKRNRLSYWKLQRAFRMPKKNNNIAIVTFKQAYYMQINDAYITWTKELQI